VNDARVIDLLEQVDALAFGVHEGFGAATSAVHAASPLRGRDMDGAGEALRHDRRAGELGPR
jgi:hypothetical protein